MTNTRERTEDEECFDPGIEAILPLPTKNPRKPRAPKTDNPSQSPKKRASDIQNLLHAEYKNGLTAGLARGAAAERKRIIALLKGV